MGVIYKITNTVNGKLYVGKTVSALAKRWREHKCAANKDFEGKYYLHRAMAKYGIDKFTIEIIDSALLDEELLAKEIEWIARLNTTDDKFGYNLTLGGEGYRHNDPAVTKRQSERQKAWWSKPENRKFFSEKMWPEEKRLKASADSKAFFASPEGKLAIERIRLKVTKISICEWCGITLSGRERQKHTRSKCPQAPPKEIIPKTPEQLLRCGNAMRDSKRPPEEVARRTAALKKRFAENPWFIPKPSPEGLKRIGEATKIRMNEPEKKASWAAERKAWWAANPEARAKISTRVWSEESRAKARTAANKRWHPVSQEGGLSTSENPAV